MRLNYILSLIVTFVTLATAPVSAASIAAPLLALSAQTHVDVVSALRANGYEVTSVARTFMGRVKIIAIKNGQTREVVVSRHTGEVKSDRSFANKGLSLIHI